MRGAAAADAYAPPPQSVAALMREQWLADIAAATNNWQQDGGALGTSTSAWHAVTADRLVGPASWVTVANGTTTQFDVGIDADRVIIGGANEDYNGPAVGNVLVRSSDPNTWTNALATIWFSGQWELRDELTDRSYMSQGTPSLSLPETLNGIGMSWGFGSCIIGYGSVTNARALTTQSNIDQATNTLVQTYLLGTNAWMSISNATLTIWRTTNGIPAALWSSAASAPGGDIDPSFTNAIWAALGNVQAQMAGKADKAWGQYAPDGSANPDPGYMTLLNAPATMHASGYSWSSYGAYSVLAQSGAVAFESGASGEARWGLDLQTNYVAFVRGGSVIIGAQAGSISIGDGVAEIVYPYESGNFPLLWFSPSLALPFSIQDGVVWVDNQNGTATVTAPAETPKGFWYATTTASIETIFDIRPPARLTGGILATDASLPVVYDSIITISSGGKTYRIPAQETP